MSDWENSEGLRLHPDNKPWTPTRTSPKKLDESAEVIDQEGPPVVVDLDTTIIVPVNNDGEGGSDTSTNMNVTVNINQDDIVEDVDEEGTEFAGIEFGLEQHAHRQAPEQIPSINDFVHQGVPRPYVTLAPATLEKLKEIMKPGRRLTIRRLAKLAFYHLGDEPFGLLCTKIPPGDPSAVECIGYVDGLRCIPDGVEDVSDQQPPPGQHQQVFLSDDLFNSLEYKMASDYQDFWPLNGNIIHPERYEDAPTVPVIETDDEEEPELFACPGEKCLEKFVNERDMEFHRDMNHKQKGKFHCPFCLKPFSQGTRSKGHVENCHMRPERMCLDNMRVLMAIIYNILIPTKLQRIEKGKKLLELGKQIYTDVELSTTKAASVTEAQTAKGSSDAEPRRGRGKTAANVIKPVTSEGSFEGVDKDALALAIMGLIEQKQQEKDKSMGQSTSSTTSKTSTSAPSKSRGRGKAKPVEPAKQRQDTDLNRKSKVMEKAMQNKPKTKTMRGQSKKTFAENYTSEDDDDDEDFIIAKSLSKSQSSKSNKSVNVYSDSGASSSSTTATVRAGPHSKAKPLQPDSGSSKLLALVQKVAPVAQVHHVPEAVTAATLTPFLGALLRRRESTDSHPSVGGKAPRSDGPIKKPTDKKKRKRPSSSEDESD